jgi:D-alanyl-D-alanine carboxypeptidase (penicillin-binding protein 5/6)
MTGSRRRARPIVLALASGAIAVCGLLAALRLSAALPHAHVTAHVAATLVPAPGPPPPIPLPSQGSAVVSSDADGVLAATHPDDVRPTGSIAKTMTALVVLRQRPLSMGAEGPTVTMTTDDVSLYARAIQQQGSAVAVRVGEQFTERQLLLALMLASANNIAETLAVWVAGSRDAFIAMLNAQAAALGMAQTHFADPSGFSEATVSTASDLVRLGRAALANPALASIVSTLQTTLPDGTVVGNLDILLASQPGWLGVKTGWTPQAGGCLLFAARQTLAPGAVPVTIVGVVLGQPADATIYPGHPELGGAFRAASAATTAALDGYVAVSPRDVQPAFDGSATAAWGATAGLRLDPANSRPLVVRAGAQLTTHLHLQGIDGPAPSGAPAGDVAAVTSTGKALRWKAVLDQPLSAPSVWWRLVRA